MTSDDAAILAAILRDPRYLDNLDWGEPRPGHPEGTVQSHIQELERNLFALRGQLRIDEIGRIRLLIHTHDTFKPQAARGVAISHPQSHASLAREFLSEFTSEDDLLAMVHLHDEPYALWRQADCGRKAPNPARLNALLQAIRDWDTFLAFLIVDNCTPGKEREPLTWFFNQIDGRITSRITAADMSRISGEWF